MCHRYLAIFLSDSSVYAANNANYEYITCLLLSGCSATLSVLEVLLPSYRIGSSRFEKKITSREERLIKEMEDVLKKTYNFVEMSKTTTSYHLETYLIEMVRFKETLSSYFIDY